MFLFAAVVKLADTLDLGSSAMSVWVQVPPAAPKQKRTPIKMSAFLLAISHFR